MDTREIVLAGLAPAKGAWHSPVQVQKLFFLIDRNVPSETEGPHFDFQPYNYGPFDSAVYATLEQLRADGLVQTVRCQSWKEYRLSDNGQLRGDEVLSRLPQKARAYLQEASAFVRSLGFTQLVRAIYKAYPEMRQNSVFQE
jgi:hypothetical protein